MRIVSALVSQLIDGELCVRQAAVKALGVVVEPGEPEALTMICGHMSHAKADMRLAAVQAYIEVASVRDEIAATTLGHALEDPHPHVRNAVVDGLLRLVVAGNGFVDAAVKTRLHHSQTHVRRTAEQLLEM